MTNRSAALFVFLLGVFLAQFLVVFPLWVFGRVVPDEFIFIAGGAGFIILGALFIGTFVNKQAALKIVIRIFFPFFLAISLLELGYFYSLRKNYAERMEMMELMQREQERADSIRRIKTLDSLMSGVEDYNPYEDQ